MDDVSFDCIQEVHVLMQKEATAGRSTLMKDVVQAPYTADTGGDSLEEAHHAELSQISEGTGIHMMIYRRLNLVPSCPYQQRLSGHRLLKKSFWSGRPRRPRRTSCFGTLGIQVDSGRWSKNLEGWGPSRWWELPKLTKMREIIVLTGPGS